MKCGRCGSPMEVQMVPVTRRRSCFTMLIYVVLLFIPIIGWFALFAMLRGSRKIGSQAYAVCQNCGRQSKL